jgi:manganese/zinc/iron transport system permease protein
VSDAAVILLTGACAAVACALPGTFLVLRGMSLVGDAISHAVLPGIVLAFLLTNSVSSWPVVVGASATGLATVFLIESLVKSGRVREDASIAVVFPALFAVGVFLVVQYAQHKDLDQECVLYGEIAYAPLDRITLGGVRLARPLLVLGCAALANALFVGLLWKELKLSTFDAAAAATLGLSPVVVHYLLMGVVSLTTVASFESVGAILVVAFLVVPPATAHLLTERLRWMVPLAAALGAAGSSLGYVLAGALNASIAGSMAVAMGVLFLVALLVAPREGLLARVVRRRRMRERVALALVLERLNRGPARREELGRDLAWTPERVDAAVVALRTNGLVTSEDGALAATPVGLAYLRSVIQ